MNAARTIVLVTLGSIGDLLPFLAVGKALRRRGHHVVLATHEEYAAATRSAGLDFEAIWDGRTSRRAFDDVLASSPSMLWRRVWDDFFSPAVRPTFHCADRLVTSRPSIVVSSWSAIGARLACEKRHVPFCSVYLSPYALAGPAADAEVPGELWARTLQEYRGKLGLQQEGRDSTHVPESKLAFFPRWFCAPQPHWPGEVVMTGFPLYDDALVPVALSKVRRFLDTGDPPIVFTPGSFMDKADGFFRDALGACNELGKRAIFLTPHRGQVPDSLPNSVLHLDYLPLSRILGRAAAIFHHGGIGTCAQAMRAGVTQMVTPIFFDQFDNADRIERLGTGSRLDRHSVGVPAMIKAVVKSASIAAANAQCEAVRDRFQEQDAAEAICDRIEALG